MTTITIFGATGGTGQALVKQGLEQGHQVVAFVRSPEKLTADRNHPGLTIVQGDVLNQIEVANAIAGSDVVISALGKTGNSPDHVVSSGTKHMIKGMLDHGVTRLIAVDFPRGRGFETAGPLYLSNFDEYLIA